MIRNLLTSLALVFASSIFLFSQKPIQPNSIELYNQVEKLNVLGSVLYIAAHPDDENTRLISYLSNEAKVRTAYLSLTRGDGGQNLIGTQIWEKLGLIRTNELLMARSTDGGTQFFSRANDFGYSKHPDETLSFWNKDEVMHDIIKVIREFRPDVIINRFDHRSPGSTHGHHTSSAMLSVEAFDMAGSKNYYTDRLPHLETWQPERVFFNTSWWFYGGRDKFKAADKSNLYAVDAGVYFSDRGISNTEIAARSRSMHKSQGFGSTGTRGSEMEYVELLKGSTPTSKEDPLSGIDLTWSRVEGGAVIRTKVEHLLSNYNFAETAKNITQLLEIHRAISKIGDKHWKQIKLAEVEAIIVASAGLYVEAVTNDSYATRREDVTLKIEAINRSQADVLLNQVHISGSTASVDVNTPLNPNERKSFEATLNVAEDITYSNPYWLDNTGTLGMYAVRDENMIGAPISPAAYTVTFDLEIEGTPISITRDITFKTNSPVDGEVYTPFYIVPQASVKFADPVYLFPNRDAKDVVVTVKAFLDDFKGTISLKHSAEWQVSPDNVAVDIKNKGGEETIIFSVKGPYSASSDALSIDLVSEDGTVLSKEVTEIEYDHIPLQVMISTAKAKVEKLDLKTRGRKIAYLHGAGDNIPKSLRQIDYDVTEIEVNDISKDNLANYDALVMGIRAYNTKKGLFLKKDIIQKYMENGGTVIVQYNTSRRIKGDDIAPYPLELSRDRVTDEHAKVTFEDANHEVLNYPNKITSKDFDGWVQERGLYFPNKWDDKYAAPIACNDINESLKSGGLLIASVGKGHFIYSGYSWFRQLPAGVPGAFRLFANMISIGKNLEVKNTSTNTGNE